MHKDIENILKNQIESTRCPMLVVLKQRSNINPLKRPLISDPKKFDAILDTFFVQLQPVLDAGFTSLANSLKKPVEDLTEEEIHTVVDAAAQMYMESMMQALALAQQVPEIAGVARKHASHTDFNKSVADNHDKIDFDRKWNHTRTKLGAPLSLDELAISDPSALEEGHNMFETNDEEYDRPAKKSQALKRKKFKKI